MTKPTLTEKMQTGKERLDALEMGATLISFIPRLVVELLTARCPVSYMGTPTTEECIAAGKCGCSHGVLISELDKRTGG